MLRQQFLSIAVVYLLVAGPGQAQGVTKSADIVGEGNRAVGMVTLTQARRGVLLKVQASGLPEGWHGMHIHSVATCADPGFKASGGHVHGMSATSVHGLLNQNETDLGDLPNIYVGKDGTAAAEVFAPNPRSAKPLDG